MKKYIKIMALMIILITVAFNSCKKLQDINENPNQPEDVTLGLLLPGAEDAIAFAQGGDAERFTSIFVQHVHGASRQFATFDQYSFTEDDVDNLWKFNLYAGPLKDLTSLKAKADEGGNNTYSAIARVLLAYTLGLTTDLWGDIPFSEAFQGSENTKPKFDKQQDIYTTIQLLLDEAIAKIDEGDASLVQPGADDFIFGGDATLWRQFAFGLKARYAIHLTKLNATDASTKALAALASGGLTGNSDNAQFAFGNTQTSSNPWYQYINERDDISYNGYLLDTMQALGDPRYAEYIDVSSGYLGYKAGGMLDGDLTGIDAPITFFTYAEQKFIEAEARERTGDAGGAQTAFGQAIQASMDQWGVDGADAAAYLADNGTLTGTSAQRLEQILFQKYVALFLKFESFTDWRRTGIPGLTANPGAVLPQIPRRLVYPQSERLSNAANTPSSTMLQPQMFWDN